MTITPIHAIIFDFDGTLAELILDFDVMKSRLFTFAQDYFDSPPGTDNRPALEWIEHAVRSIPTQQRAEAFRNGAMQCIEDMEVEAAAQGTLFPFTRPVLQCLRNAKIKTGVITRNCRSAVETVFPDWSDFTEILLTRDDVTHVKPDPRHLLQALETMHVPVTHALMVGDHPMDIETGKNAGTMTAGTASGRNSLERLHQSDPTYAEENIYQLYKTLHRLGLIPAQL